MLTTIRNAFKIPELRKKLLYTAMMLVVIRFGSLLPVPGVDKTFIQMWFAQLAGAGDAFNFLDALTGGSFTNMSVFALSITPYITSSIIMQLLTIAIPKLEEMQKDGEDGRKKIAEYTRYVTVLLALIQSSAMAIGFGRQGLLTTYNFWSVIVAIAAMTAGSALLMWIGEQITQNGIGNGISIVLLINIVSSLPGDANTLYTVFVAGASNIGFAALYASDHHRRDPRCGGVCRDSSERRAPDSGAVFQEDAGPENGWRTVYPHSVKGKHRRRYSGNLRVFHHVLPGCDRTAGRGSAHRDRRPDSGSAQLFQLVSAGNAGVFRGSDSLCGAGCCICILSTLPSPSIRWKWPII